MSSEALETAIATIREDIATCSDRPELIATLRAVEMQFLRSLNHLQVAGTLLESLHAVVPERIGVHFFPAYGLLHFWSPILKTATATPDAASEDAEGDDDDGDEAGEAGDGGDDGDDAVKGGGVAVV